MGKKMSLGWAVVILLVMIILWSPYWLKKFNSKVKGTTHVSRRIVNETLTTPRPLQNETLDSGSNKNVWVYFEKLNRTSVGPGVGKRRTKRIRRRRANINDEFEDYQSVLERRHLTPGSGNNHPMELLKKGCIPVHKPSPGDNGVNPNQAAFRPCPFEFPPTVEPIDLVLYKGTKSYGEACSPDSEIAAIQLHGQEKYEGDLEFKISRKASSIEAITCVKSWGLECFLNVDKTHTDNTGSGRSENTAHEYKCGCMAAMGRSPKVIDGKCYIPVSKGQDSDCYEGQDGFPQPTGDTQNPQEWNQVQLSCVSGAICKESSRWFGKRCVCKKEFKENEDGTCSTQSRMTVALPLLELLLFVLLTILF